MFVCYMFQGATGSQLHLSFLLLSGFIGQWNLTESETAPSHTCMLIGVQQSFDFHSLGCEASAQKKG